MVIATPDQTATEFIEFTHEATRLYRENRIAWGRRVAFFNNNSRARSRLVDVPKPYAGDAIFAAGLLSRILLRRKSTRNFSQSPVPISIVGDLFRQAVMARKLPDPSELINGRRRSYSSAGAIYAVEHYIIGLNVDGVPNPFTAYCSPQNRKIIMVEPNADRNELRKALGLEQSVLPAFAVVQTIDLERSTRKYQERGYRFALIEAGLACQTLCLVGVTLDLGSVIWGGHFDHLIEQGLRVLGTHETAVNTILFGGHSTW
ncbi:SagB family peptide dehydrogenase [Sinorhizobium sp. 8-89]|uniref:SagB family peptide dehydrogenase n=1 Tax=Sinorhizobium sp. 7-81 TaxID=3049087 RepID=UPI0024C2A52A|nr:SagB family peptide dehydrogenase [Sinorhizobium sp. 7-81]MDK1390024.1 SagB family peptide dehydrogenase [Sinorhizobium sp. 7-81]